MQEILFPAGRLVSGSLYRPQPVLDNFGKPVIGADGKPKTKFSFGVAFPKNGTTHWAQIPEWGAKIWAEGHAGFPNGEAQHPSFAWKIQDGDSAIPNKRGNKPVDNEGWPGQWVVFFSGTFAPKTCSATGDVTYNDGEERIKPGHFVQVFGSVKDNKPSQSPGVYMNFALVAHSGFGPEIAVGVSVDATKVGFGGAPLPAGASAVPLGQMQAPASPGAPAAPMAVPGAPAAPLPGPATPSAVPAAITPNPAFLQVPASATPVPQPTIAAPPVAAPVRQMTAKAAGHSYDAMRAAGWADEALIAQGYMTA